MRRKSVLIALVILAFGLIGTGLSTLYKQNEWTNFTGKQATYKVSHGFPLGWYGNSQTVGGVITPLPEVYWFSFGSLLLDAAFWVAISFFACIAAIKSVNMLHKTRVSKNLSVINI